MANLRAWFWWWVPVQTAWHLAFGITPHPAGPAPNPKIGCSANEITRKLALSG